MKKFIYKMVIFLTTFSACTTQRNAFAPSSRIHGDSSVSVNDSILLADSSATISTDSVEKDYWSSFLLKNLKDSVDHRDDEDRLYDSTSVLLKKSEEKWNFHAEELGTLQVEKSEIAGGTNFKDGTFNGALQVLFPWALGNGRTFVTASHEKKGENFLDATLDLTVGKFPLHLGYSIGNDQAGHDPHTIFTGYNATIFWSDLKFVHKNVNILRTSIIRETLTKDALGDSITSFKGWELMVFFQTKQYGNEQGLNFFAEGLFRLRGDKSITELEFGVRHHKVDNNRIGIGFYLTLDDLNLHEPNFGIVARFNVGNANSNQFVHTTPTTNYKHP